MKTKIIIIVAVVLLGIAVGTGLCNLLLNSL